MNKASSKSRTTIEDLFIHELSDIYSAEKQITKALPKLARASTNPKLAEAFNAHLEETQGQIQRIDQLVEQSEIKLKRVKCIAMEGLIEESKELLEEIEKGPVLDAGLIAACQKVEHYEIAGYGTLIAMAKHLGLDDAASLLGETLEEEKSTDQKLTAIAEEGGTQAATLDLEDQDSEDDQAQEKQGRQKKRQA
ncbi:YciE/YciF ferroxidase family protein [Pseudomonas lijiangensis]|uniref:Ferritin-like domain-containing protein n=1 Tax=Pseudomonas lijiangensis TaxID=2995658 RepID=A0ABX8HQK6_9PSED|nr:ferritin-like domain-containing protein [Pseudomonas lijiangensis]MBX8500155.1 ferritin-like domain-containing protein [Pseudomonas lijiangensis]MBX8503914.1 ferritin-like domain-containing protein [Pseudomonas lijiangensis]QWU81701.1 ferritin-like domain-containing protein [Pseudomonas lijiangensis]